ncbi:MAG: indolepyruvate ferredoxin oxidoreductase subunit alpha, partial [Candidatus Omnitrophica bacterium]|nr:indolepyruvate ferredoxin oxidoreductase subunit alpha [Candidatus Omnitrophota bacterium]
MKVLLSGNEAIASAAYENGIKFAAGYPGTPATEILEEISAYQGINAQWSVNEKVALDVAVGASLGGLRSLVAMKHVGMNVASDTLMTLSYVGVNAGLIIVTVDDPGMHSSQNEQDNRNYAKFAKIPLLEPSDSQEAKDFVRIALHISEKYDVPVFIRLTARIAHTESIVKMSGNDKNLFVKKLSLNPAKYVMIPSNARARRLFVEKRLKRLERFSEEFSFNRVEWKKGELGIITSGLCYQYARESCPNASILKLSLTYPLPNNLILNFAKKFPFIYVIEELDPFLQEQIQAMGVKVKGRELFPFTGELSVDLIQKHLLRQVPIKSFSFPKRTFSRSPSLCAGCAYLGLFYILKKMKMIVIGDIGCYSLCALPPLSSLETCISMGSGLGIAQGLRSALNKKLKKRVVGVIGDSTFIHSGIPALINSIYNKEITTTIILDNQATAMTGGQDHPGTGVNIRKEKVPKTSFEALTDSLGIKKTIIIDSYNLR